MTTRSTQIAGALIGVVFGVVLSWSGMADPDVIRDALLFHDSYLFLFFGSAVLTGFVGLRILARVRSSAVLVDEPIACPTDRPERRHVTGALLFGAGWGVANVCPGPVAAQLGQGVAWSLVSAVGVLGGVALYLRRQAREPVPATR